MYSQQDAFEEVTVQKAVTGQIKALHLMSVVFTVLFFIAAFLFHYLFILPAIVYLVITIFNYMNTHGIEYEYEYTAGTLEIYKIIRQKKRKLLVIVDCKDIIVMAPAGTEPVLPYKGRKMKTYDVTSLRDDVPFYVLIYKDTKLNAECKIFFEATEALAVAMRNANPRQVTVAPRG